MWELVLFELKKKLKNPFFKCILFGFYAVFFACFLILLFAKNDHGYSIADAAKVFDEAGESGPSLDKLRDQKNKELLQLYDQLLSANDLTSMSSSLITQIEIQRSLITQINQLLDYPDYIQSIKSSAEQIISSGSLIVSEYSTSSAQKTQKAYAKIERNPQLAGLQGFSILFSSKLLLSISFAAVIFISISFFLLDEVGNRMYLIHSTPLVH